MNLPVRYTHDGHGCLTSIATDRALVIHRRALVAVRNRQQLKANLEPTRFVIVEGRPFSSELVIDEKGSARSGHIHFA
jgi:hypothetical protein